MPKKLDSIYTEEEVHKRIGKTLKIGDQVDVATRYGDVAEVPLRSMFSAFGGFRETKKYVDYSDTTVIEDLPEFIHWFGKVPVSEVMGPSNPDKKS